MKKIGTLVLTILLIIVSTVSVSGCSDNDGFHVVKSVTFTTNGEEKKFSSSQSPSFKMENDDYITAHEFNNAPNDRKIYEAFYDLDSRYSVNDAIKAAKNATYYEVYEKELAGIWYITYSWTNGVGNTYYKKGTYKNTYFNFVYVKVKNDTTLVIKSGNAETTYTVSSYRITEF